MSYVDVMKSIFCLQVKAIGMHSVDVLQMVTECPPDAEVLVMKVADVLTRRGRFWIRFVCGVL